MWIDENHIHFLDFIFSCCHIRNYSTTQHPLDVSNPQNIDDFGYIYATK